MVPFFRRCFSWYLAASSSSQARLTASSASAIRFPEWTLAFLASVSSFSAHGGGRDQGGAALAERTADLRRKLQILERSPAVRDVRNELFRLARLEDRIARRPHLAALYAEQLGQGPRHHQAVATGVGGEVVAAVLAQLAHLVAQPPHRGVVEQQRLDHDLEKVDQAITAPDMGQLAVLAATCVLAICIMVVIMRRGTHYLALKALTA